MPSWNQYCGGAGGRADNKISDTRSKIKQKGEERVLGEQGTIYNKVVREGLTEEISELGW